MYVYSVIYALTDLPICLFTCSFISVFVVQPRYRRSPTLFVSSRCVFPAFYFPTSAYCTSLFSSRLCFPHRAAEDKTPLAVRTFLNWTRFKHFHVHLQPCDCSVYSFFHFDVILRYTFLRSGQRLDIFLSNGFLFIAAFFHYIFFSKGDFSIFLYTKNKLFVM